MLGYVLLVIMRPTQHLEDNPAVAWRERERERNIEELRIADVLAETRKKHFPNTIRVTAILTC
jgi:hypothetical protein